MTDDQDKQPRTPGTPRKDPNGSSSGARSRRPAGQPPADVAGGPDDPEAALARLQSLEPGEATGAASAGSTVYSSPPPSPVPRKPSKKAAAPASRARTRRGGPSNTTRLVARVAAPAVFLVAVIALFAIVSQSHVLGGSEVAVTPSPVATHVKGGKKHTAPSGTKYYRVKAGDTLSGIAVKFNSSSSDIQALNPKVSFTTLRIGTKILVPTP